MKKEAAVVDALEAWLEAGRSLLASDSETFTKVLSLARGYVALSERELERAEIFQSRLDQILPRSTKASA